MTDDSAYPDLADRYGGDPATPEQLRYAAAAAEWEAAHAAFPEVQDEAARIVDAADARIAAAEIELRACELAPGRPRPECVKVA